MVYINQTLIKSSNETKYALIMDYFDLNFISMSQAYLVWNDFTNF